MRKRLAIPSAAFDHLLSRPRGGGILRHLHVENLPAGVIDHEEHAQCSERDRSDAEEVARPRSPSRAASGTTANGKMARDDGFVGIYLAAVLAETLNPSLASSA